MRCPGNKVVPPPGSAVDGVVVIVTDAEIGAIQGDTRPPPRRTKKKIAARLITLPFYLGSFGILTLKRFRRSQLPPTAGKATHAPKSAGSMRTG
jgi:hypothetical protein